MILLAPPSNISCQHYPCPNCHAPTPVEVITRIESEEALTNFFALDLNRARCSFCGVRVEAPVRVSVSLADYPLMNHECVPIALLDRPEVLEDLCRNNPKGLKRVYSHDELERSIEAWLLVEMHRKDQLHAESEVAVAP